PFNAVGGFLVGDRCALWRRTGCVLGFGRVKLPCSDCGIGCNQGCGKPQESEREFCVSHGIPPLCRDYTARGFSVAMVGSCLWRAEILQAGDVEEGGGDGVSEKDAKDHDCGLHEFVDDLAFVGHKSRVTVNALMVLAADQIFLKICSNIY